MRTHPTQQGCSTFSVDELDRMTCLSRAKVVFTEAGQRLAENSDRMNRILPEGGPNPILLIPFILSKCLSRIHAVRLNAAHAKMLIGVVTV